MPPVIVLPLLAIAGIFIAVIVVRPEITVARGGKIMAFLALFICPALLTVLIFAAHMERSKQPFFVFSFHIMGPYGKIFYVDNSSYVPPPHFQNTPIPRNHACYPCHTNYTI